MRCVSCTHWSIFEDVQDYGDTSEPGLDLSALSAKVRLFLVGGPSMVNCNVKSSDQSYAFCSETITLFVPAEKVFGML